MVICLERGADLHMAQLMPLPLTVSCVSKIQIGFTFLVPAHSGSPGKRARVRVCVPVSERLIGPFCISDDGRGCAERSSGQRGRMRRRSVTTHSDHWTTST